MKKLPLIIGIPAIAVALVVGAALYWRMQTQLSSTVENRQMPGVGGTAAKPANPFSALFGTKIEPTPTPASAADLQKDLDTSTADDGGASDMQDLQKDASGL